MCPMSPGCRPRHMERACRRLTTLLQQVTLQLRLNNVNCCLTRKVAMSPTIKIDDGVFDELKKHAEPFVDTPNSVLRRLLGLAEAEPASNGRGEVGLDESEVVRAGGGRR